MVYPTTNNSPGAAAQTIISCGFPLARYLEWVGENLEKFERAELRRQVADSWQRETKVETFTWTLPDEIAVGRVEVRAVLNFQKLVSSVAEFLNVPAEEAEVIAMNTAETWFEVYE